MKKNSVLNSDYLRYTPQIALSEIGVLGQKKLINSKVLCIGLGGLAASALPYLVSTGVGTLGIIDGDQVELSNLHRQLLYREKDIKSSKTRAAAKFLKEINSKVDIQPYDVYLTEKNASKLLKDYDYILDASDNFATHLLLNDLCWFLKKPLVLSAAEKYFGYCMSVLPSLSTPCFRCFISQKIPEQLSSCSQTGVLATVPGILGLCEATQIIKIILGLTSNMSGHILWCDALTLSFKNYTLLSDPACPLCSLQTHPGLLTRPSFNKETSMNDHLSEKNFTNITYHEFVELTKKNPELILIDVRNQNEHAQTNLGGTCIPLDELIQDLKNPAKKFNNIFNEENMDRLILVYCQRGIRSQSALQALQGAGFKKVLSLRDGISGIPVT